MKILNARKVKIKCDKSLGFWFEWFNFPPASADYFAHLKKCDHKLKTIELKALLINFVQAVLQYLEWDKAWVLTFP